MRAVDTDFYTWRTWSDCVLVTAASPAKTAEPIEMPFGAGKGEQTHVGQGTTY